MIGAFLGWMGFHWMDHRSFATAGLWRGWPGIPTPWKDKRSTFRYNDPLHHHLGVIHFSTTHFLFKIKFPQDILYQIEKRHKIKVEKKKNKTWCPWPATPWRKNNKNRFIMICYRFNVTWMMELSLAGTVSGVGWATPGWKKFKRYFLVKSTTCAGWLSQDRHSGPHATWAPLGVLKLTSRW